MAQTPEGKVKDWIKRRIDNRFKDNWKYMPPGGRFGKKGVPDIICCIKGIFVAIEAKTEKGTLTPTQEYQLAKLELAGAATAVIYGKSDEEKLTKLFEFIDKEADKLQGTGGTCKG